MSSNPSYVSTVFYIPTGGAQLTGSAEEIARRANVDDVVYSSSRALYTPVSGQLPPPFGGDRGSPYRITNIHVSDEQERDNIRKEEERIARSQVEDERTWSWTITAWNVVAFLLCPVCAYCMLGALLCNVLAYVDHKSRDYAGQRRKLRRSLWWSIVIFVAGIVTVIVILVVLFVVYDAKSWNSVPTVPGSDFTM